MKKPNNFPDFKIPIPGKYRRMLGFLTLFSMFFAIGFVGPILAQTPICCNILTNGDFEQGAVGFTSSLPQNCGCAASSYCVNTNFQTKCSGWQNVNDHTSGSGKFLIVDGDDNSPVPVDVWRTNTTINAGANYCFSFWVASQYDLPFDLGLAVNGTPVSGAVFSVQQGTASWTQYTFNWTATGAGTNISIQQLVAGSFQDFGIDDIEFGQAITANFSYSPDITCGMNVSFFNQSTGPAPLTYMWNFNDPNSPDNISNQPNPTHKFTDCGTYEICLTVTRGSCSQTYCESVLVEDTDPPTALCLGVGVTLNANCMATVTPAIIDGGSFDNCYVASMSVSPSVILGCGLHLVTLTVRDSCGNTSTCSVDVQAFEAVPPKITCPANVSVNAIPANCSILINGITWLTVTDNCSQPTVIYKVTGATQKTGPNDVSGTVFNQGHSVVTYTATDGCGNTATCSFEILVTCAAENCACPAGGAPSANLIANGNFSSGPSGFGSGLVLNTSCGAGFYDVDKNFKLFCPPWDSLPDHTNDIQRKYLIIDGADNGVNTKTDLWTSNVVITTNTAYCFSFWWASAYANADFDFDIEAYIRVGTTDYVLGTTKILQNTIIWTPATYNWNSGTGVFGPQIIHIRQVSGDDHRDFGIDDICFKAEQAPCDAAFNFQNINNCGKVQFTSTSTGPAGLTYCWDFDGDPNTCESTLANPMWQFPACGTYNVCLTISGNGCSSTACHTVVVVDNTPPVALCQLGVGVILDANCQYAVTPAFVDGGSTDNCQIKSMSVSPAVLTGCGTTTVTLTVTDWCNNSSTCTMGIQTGEGVPPIMTCPANISINGTIGPNGLCTATFNLVPPVATDNCDLSVTVTNNAPPVFQQGPNTIVWTATDDCGNQTTCTQIVTVQCSCQCGSFSNLFARPTVGAPSIPLTCGGPVVHFPCPAAGQSIPITGKFECQGTNCPATSQINWTLIEPTGMATSGTVQSGPYFFLPILPLQYAQVGAYALILKGSCGGMDCPPCVIHFTVDCPNPCPCDVIQFQKDVSKGFATALSATSCKACLSPIALNDCDMVEWKVNGTTIGTTNGGQSFCHTFLSAGTYTVTMIVSRKKSDGSPCETFSFTKSVTVTCIIKDPCDNSVFPNSAFNIGAVVGGINSEGASAGWYGPCGEPVVVEGEPGSHDGWNIQISGNLDSSDVLAPLLPVCLKKGTGTINMRIKVEHWGDPHEILNCKHLHIQLYQGDQFEMNDCDGISCFEIASIDLEPFDSGWVDLQVPYDLSSWEEADISCGAILSRVAIFMTTAIGSNQGGQLETRSGIQVDNFCLDGSLVRVKDLPYSNLLRIFPNPNVGTFSVQLPEPAKPGTTFRVTDLTGRLVQEQKTEPGSAQQTVRAGELPAGLYFLMVVSEGKVLAVEKFVKQ